MTHRIHQTLPSGFSYADALQTAEYNDTGSVRGAGKIILVVGEDPDELNLAIRLEPPESWAIVPSSTRAKSPQTTVVEYVREYNLGYRAAARGANSKAFNDGTSSAAFDDGYLDRATGRPKWHLTYCTNHDNTDDGCQEA